MPNPARWRWEHQTLVVSDEGDRELWRHPFEFEITLADYLSAPPAADQRAVMLADLDGDGRREVLIRILSEQTVNNNLYVFNADGVLRFTHRVDAEVWYGNDRYGSPFGIGRLIIDRAGQSSRIVIAAQHLQWFPSVVRSLSSRGEVLSEHWTNGHISVVASGQLGSRPILAVGGVHNETRFASLAVLDPSKPATIAPAETARYICSSCSGEAPLGFLLFPQSALGERVGALPS